MPFVLLDAGSFSHKSPNLMAETEATWNEMARLEYDAVTLGLQELNQWDELDSLRSAVKLPLVCTNLEQFVDGAWVQIGERYRIVESNGIKVGIMSVVNEMILTDTVVRNLEGKVRILEPHESTRLVSRELKSKCQVVVLLAYLDPGSMTDYARTMEDVDVIVGGHMTNKDEGPLKFGHAIVNRSGTRGRWLSNTRLILSPDDEICEFGGKNITLSPSIPEDPKVAARALAAQALTTERRKSRKLPTPRKAAPADGEKVPVPKTQFRPSAGEPKNH